MKTLRRSTLVPGDGDAVVRTFVGLGRSVRVTDGASGGGDVTQMDTFHTGRPLRDGGLSQVTSSCLSRRPLLFRSEKRSSFVY